MGNQTTHFIILISKTGNRLKQMKLVLLIIKYTNYYRKYKKRITDFFLKFKIFL